MSHAPLEISVCYGGKKYIHINILWTRGRHENVSWAAEKLSERCFFNHLGVQIVGQSLSVEVTTIKDNFLIYT